MAKTSNTVKKSAVSLDKKPLAPPAIKTITKGEVKKLEEITIKDLCAKYNLEGKKLRGIIRLAGFKAPATGVEGMGPKFKYIFNGWGDPRLVKIDAAVQAYFENQKLDNASDDEESDD